MGLDVAAVQEALRTANLDGWLLYDFHGSNPIAARLAGLTGGGHMTTRRWYYLIPAIDCLVKKRCTRDGSSWTPV
jgi:Xaa-Pro dipeptidase